MVTVKSCLLRMKLGTKWSCNDVLICCYKIIDVHSISKALGQKEVVAVVSAGPLHTSVGYAEEQDGHGEDPHYC
jgi:hypothetical protein